MTRSPSSGKLREIERLRGVAILLAMFHHGGEITKLLPPQLSQTWSGVDLFFVISGYVVSLSFSRLLPPLDGAKSFAEAFDTAKGALRTFFVRRFFRIMPAALTVMVLNRVLAAVYPPIFGQPNELIDEAVAFFGGALNYVSGYRILENSYYWSLSVEEHFYLMLPFLFLVCRTRTSRVGAVVLVGLVSIFSRNLPAPPGVDNLYIRFASHTRFDTLMAGVGLALLAPKDAVAPLMPRALMRFFVLPAAIALLAALPYCAGPTMYGEGFIALWAISALLVRFAALDQGYVLEGPVLSRVLEYIGSRSYALYLMHLPMFRLEEAFGKLFPAYIAVVPFDDPAPWSWVVISLIMAFIAAEILHRTVELPLNRLGHELSRPGAPPYVMRRPTKIAVSVAGGVVAFILLRHPILSLFGPKDLALDRPVKMSSHDPGRPGGDALVNGWLESDLGACTKKEQSPWMVIDLGAPTSIGSVRVYNRNDGYQDEQIPIVLSTSQDGVTFTDIAKHERMFTQSLPWRIRVFGPPVRYVRLMHPKETVFCLSEVEVFKTPFMAHIP